MNTYIEHLLLLHFHNNFINFTRFLKFHIISEVTETLRNTVVIKHRMCAKLKKMFAVEN